MLNEKALLRVDDELSTHDRPLFQTTLVTPVHG